MWDESFKFYTVRGGGEHPTKKPRAHEYTITFTFSVLRT